jgi:tRNA(Arg) A34 adenosine deaminase TadA
MESDEFYMAVALEEARLAAQEGEVPVGAVVVYQDAIIAKGHNHREAKKDISSHAEIEAIKPSRSASWNLEPSRLHSLRNLRTLPHVFRGNHAEPNSNVWFLEQMTKRRGP